MKELSQVWKLISGRALDEALRDNHAAHEKLRDAIGLNSFDKTISEIDAIIEGRHEPARRL